MANKMLLFVPAVSGKTHPQRKGQAGLQGLIKLLCEDDLCCLKREAQSNSKVLEPFP